MLRVGMALVGVALSLSALGGCGDSNGQLVEICERSCDCRPGVPAQRDACFDECVTELGEIPPGFELPAACVECFQTASCPALGACFELCADDEPEPGEEDL